MNAPEVRRAQLLQIVSEGISQHYGFVPRLIVEDLVADLCNHVERAQGNYQGWLTTPKAVVEPELGGAA